jgi:hypothetical protein
MPPLNFTIRARSSFLINKQIIKISEARAVSRSDEIRCDLGLIKYEKFSPSRFPPRPWRFACGNGGRSVSCNKSGNVPNDLLFLCDTKLYKNVTRNVDTVPPRSSTGASISQDNSSWRAHHPDTHRDDRYEKFHPLQLLTAVGPVYCFELSR